MSKAKVFYGLEIVVGILMKVLVVSAFLYLMYQLLISTIFGLLPFVWENIHLFSILFIVAVFIFEREGTNKSIISSLIYSFQKVEQK